MELKIIEDGKYQYLEQGEGEVIVVLHGLFGALSNFKDVVDCFSKDYKVVIPMLPIYELAITSTNIKNLAKFVDEFITYKKFGKVNLLGNSLGGHIGLVYTIAHPEKVKTLTLTGSSGLYENAMGGTFPRRNDYNYITEKVGLTFYDPKIATKELVDECFEIVNNRGKAIRTLALAKSAIRHNVKDDLPTIKAPVCLIWGENDTITPPEVAEEFKKLLPNADLAWIDKCGHAPMMEHPQEFNDILTEWYKKTL